MPDIVCNIEMLKKRIQKEKIYNKQNYEENENINEFNCLSSKMSVTLLKEDKSGSKGVNI